MACSWGLCISAAAQKLEFGLGYQAVFKTYNALYSGSLEKFHAVDDETVRSFVHGLTATQAFRTERGYFGLFENLQWQQINIHAVAGYS